MRILVSIAAVAAAFAAGPAAATGGLLCATASKPEIKVSIGFGHVAGAPIVSERLRVDGADVPAIVPQWWLTDREVKMQMTSPDALDTLLVLEATRKGPHYDGQVSYRGKTHWVRCRED